MISPQVERMIQALLYEGYILYPYRPATKNRQRWTFGGLYPPGTMEPDGSGGQPHQMQTECLVSGKEASVSVHLRFLHVTQRLIARPKRPCHLSELSASPDIEWVSSLEVNGRTFEPWQEAIEQAISLEHLDAAKLVRQPLRREFTFPSERTLEPIAGPDDMVAAIVVRLRQPVCGALELSTSQVASDLLRLTFRVENRTVETLDQIAKEFRGAPAPHENQARDPALQIMASTHTLLEVCSGEFVSLLHPPPDLAEAATGCQNVRTWPVLVGQPGDKRTLLSSPIILYDYPLLADESPGDLCDGTEIDEILSLRIMTLGDDEKQRMRDVDERARDMLVRTESLDAAQMARLHGTFRGLQPAISTGAEP